MNDGPDESLESTDGDAGVDAGSDAGTDAGTSTGEEGSARDGSADSPQRADHPQSGAVSTIEGREPPGGQVTAHHSDHHSDVHRPATSRPTVIQRLRSADRVELFIVAAIGLLLVGFIWGISLGVTGEDRYRIPDRIESVEPVPGALQVDPSTAIILDLEVGYTGILTIDEVEIETVSIDDIRTQPGQQIDLPPVTIYEPGNATLTFRPQLGSQFERWAQGDHTVKVTYWKLVDGESTARNFTWQFRAT